jgi:hypothetical protein
MQNRLFTCYSTWMTLAGLILGPTAAFAQTIRVDSAAQVAALNGTGANYGPPANATFPDGPFTIASGTSATLTGGPAAANADTILLVLSATSANVASLGSIKLAFDSATGSPVTITSANFFTTAAGGFPSSIPGIANGAVNGISFPTAEHAAVDITFSGPLTKGADLGDVTITTPINLRVDVFGDSSSTGRIVGNAANSGAEGVRPIPEPSPMALFGVGAIGLVGIMVVRHRRHYCTSA